MALLPTEPALAHVDVRPRLVVQGTATVLRIELPRLRPGAPPVRLEVEGDGVAVLAGELLGVARGETLWNVRVLVSRSVPPGELPVVLRAQFGDGESVEVDGSIVVVPPAEQPGGGFPWAGVSIGVTLALALALGALVVARRRS